MEQQLARPHTDILVSDIHCFIIIDPCLERIWRICSLIEDLLLQSAYNQSYFACAWNSKTGRRSLQEAVTVEFFFVNLVVLLYLPFSLSTEPNRKIIYFILFICILKLLHVSVEQNNC